MTLLAFSGGLWSALLLRDMVSAFNAPVLFRDQYGGDNSHSRPLDCPFGQALFHHLCRIFAAYAVAGFFWARRLFMEAQDVGWDGGQVFLSAGRSFSLGSLGFKFNGNKTAGRR